MKRSALSRDLVPINEFRANLASWMEHLEQTKRPVVITQRGRATAVLVDPEMLDEMDQARDVVQRVLRGLEEVARGRLHDDEDVWNDVEQILHQAETRARSLD
jgi:prevent-host-death family protein